jgi:hypothetical protein
MFRTIKRLIALSLGIAFPVDAHLYEQHKFRKYIYQQYSMETTHIIFRTTGGHNLPATLNHHIAVFQEPPSLNHPASLSTIVITRYTMFVTNLTRLTCPRPCLFLPWLRRLTVIFYVFININLRVVTNIQR